MSPVLGQTISHYEVLELLGGGGMGVVYRARDLKLDRTVALKFLPPDLTRDPDAKERFVREARAASSLQHNNICVVYDVDETDDGQMFISMEYLRGETLEQKIRRGPLTIDEAIDIATQVARGLATAHANAIIHRDIKPANVLITTDGVAKIVDFGLAKLSGQTVLTKAGVTLGTVAYMSPEQIQSGEVDHRTDLWSLGVVLYELLTGELPFKGDHNAALLYSIVHVDALPLQIDDSGPGAGVGGLVHGLLEKDRERRIPTAEALLQRLRGLTTAAVPGGRANPGARKTIAVLPFANLSPAPDNEFFTAGITDEITGSLSRIKQLKVCSRSMALLYKGKLIDPRIVGKELGADVILEGSIRRIGQRIRLAVELTDTGNGFQLWAQSYDRQIEDVFAVQDEIAQTIVQALELHLTSADRTDLLQKYKANARAYDEYLRGRFLWNKRQEQPVKEAMEHFQRAIEIDPDYTLAHSDLATCYAVLSNYAWMDSKEAYRLGNEALQKAIALDPDLDEVQVAWAQYRFVQFELENARASYERALQLNPENVTAHHWLAYVHLAKGAFGSALRENREALRLEPLSLIVNAYAGFIHFCMGNQAEALTALNKSVDLEGTFSTGHHLKAWVLAWSGRFDEAIRSVDESAKGWGDHRQLLVARGVIEARRGNAEGARASLGRLLDRGRSGIFVHPYDAACVYAVLGDRENMYASLARAADTRFYWWFVLLNVHPLFEPYRQEAPFRALLDTLGVVK